MTTLTEPKPSEAARLQRALSELSRIEGRRQAIVQFDEARLQAVRDIISERQKAAIEMSDAEKRQDIDAYRKALRKYADAQSRATILDGFVISSVRESAIDRGRVGLLKGEFPELKTVLVNALNAKVAVVQKQADEVFVQEEAQLKGEDFDENQIRNSPRCYRAFGRVTQWRGILERVASNSIEETFVNVAAQLLDDEQAIG